MTSQPPLFCEDIYDALHATVLALGGFKKVGVALRPDMSADAAGRWLADCTNPQNDHELRPSQLAQLRRMGRDTGVHTLMYFEARDAGYAEPIAIDPEDERAELERQVLSGVGELRQLVARLENLTKRTRR